MGHPYSFFENTVALTTYRGLLHAIELRSNPETFHWQPIPELNRTDADVSLSIITAGNIYYDKPVEDPLFAAHVVRHDPLRDVYTPDHRSGALTCAIQVSLNGYNLPKSSN